MNYYLPFNTIPYETQSAGLLSRIFKNGINWSSILTNTQKTLNIINQTIPVIKQAKPVINNAKTMFKVMNEFKKIDTPTKKETMKETIKQTTTNNQNNPTFFL
jgi:hypothetical protein